MTRTPSTPTVRPRIGVVALVACGALLVGTGTAAGGVVETAPTAISPFDSYWDGPSPVSWLGSPLAMLTLLVGMAAAAVGLARHTSERDTDAGDADDGEDHHAPARREFAAAADRAADRLAAGDPEAVYAAWLSMVRALEVTDPESCSEAQFARRAEAVGIDPGLVEDLTGVFEVLRYGSGATDAREAAAVAALRRVADRYGDAGE